MNRGLSFALFFLIAGYAFSQSCTQRLNQAEDRYDQGRLLEIESLISACLENGSFTEGEAIRARKLLTKVAIFTDNEPKAEEELVNLLNIDPIHQLQQEDPSEMQVLMNKFRTWPVYRLEFYVSGNYSLPSQAQTFSVFPNETDNKVYTSNLGFGGGARITKHLRDIVYGVEVGGGFEYRTSSYTVTSTPGNQVFETTITNNQAMFRLPLFARYNFNPAVNANFAPYVFVGGSLDFTMSAQYSEGNRSGGTSFNIESDASDLIKLGQVSKTNISLIMGAGAKLAAGKGNFFFAEARFDKSLLLYNVPEERYSNPQVFGDLQFVEDDTYLDLLSVNFGYVWSIFKPEKLQK